jgi:hypothetical protein
MKKIGALIIALAFLAVALPVMADTMVGGEFQYFTTTDFEFNNNNFKKVELNITGELDEYNTVKLELDSEGDPGSIGPVAVDDFRLVSDVGGALGLPVAVTYTVGYFDTYFTGWWYDRNAWCGYYDWPNQLVNQGPTASGAHQLDIGVGPATVHWYNSFAADPAFMVGVNADLDMGLGLWLAYGNTTFEAVGDGDISLEAQYGMDVGKLSLTIPAHFRYGLGSEMMTYMAGVKVGTGMLAIGAYLEGDDVDALDNIAVDLNVAAMEGLDLWATLFMNMNSDNAFTAAEIEASYAIGAAKIILGYVIGGEDGTTVPIFGDAIGNLVADGVYFGVDVDY